MTKTKMLVLINNNRVGCDSRSQNNGNKPVLVETSKIFVGRKDMGQTDKVEGELDRQEMIRMMTGEIPSNLDESVVVVGAKRHLDVKNC